MAGKPEPDDLFFYILSKREVKKLLSSVPAIKGFQDEQFPALPFLHCCELLRSLEMMPGPAARFLRPGSMVTEIAGPTGIG